MPRQANKLAQSLAFELYRVYRPLCVRVRWSRAESCINRARGLNSSQHWVDFRLKYVPCCRSKAR